MASYFFLEPKSDGNGNSVHTRLNSREGEREREMNRKGCAHDRCSRARGRQMFKQFFVHEQTGAALLLFTAARVAAAQMLGSQVLGFRFHLSSGKSAGRAERAP